MTRYGLNGPRIESRLWGPDFPHPSSPALGSLSGGKAAGAGVDHPHLSSADVKDGIVTPSTPHPGPHGAF